MSLESDLHDRGERRHEQCRFGIFSREAYQVTSETTPIALPLCGWKIPQDAPPAVSRAWGGSIDFGRDCALCDAFQTIDGSKP